MSVCILGFFVGAALALMEDAARLIPEGPAADVEAEADDELAEAETPTVWAPVPVFDMIDDVAVVATELAVPSRVGRGMLPCPVPCLSAYTILDSLRLDIHLQ